MSAPDAIAGLESALLERARKLAREYVAHAHREHDRLLAEANRRLHQEELREQADVQALADRACRRQVQAAELQLRADLDRLRLELVTAILDRLPAHLEQIAADGTHYLPLLLAWLREGALSIESGELVAQFNARDLRRMRPGWEHRAHEAAPGKHVALCAEPLDCGGGVLVMSAARTIRVDNTFEGRRERLGERLQNAVADQLWPAPVPGGN